VKLGRLEEVIFLDGRLHNYYSLVKLRH